MASYRFFYIDRGHVEYAASFDAENDMAAAQVVRERQHGRTAELWNQDRYVAEYRQALQQP